MDTVTINCAVVDADTLEIRAFPSTGKYLLLTAREGGTPSATYLDSDRARQLRDVLNEFLGEAAKPTAPTLAALDTEDLVGELGKRLYATPIDARRVSVLGKPETAALVAEEIWNAFTWSDAPGGPRFWSLVARQLARVSDAMDDAHRDAARAAELRGYQGDCPPGYRTVLGHLVLRGEQPEDMGLAAGLQAARAAKTRPIGYPIPVVWVAAPEALEGVCERVRAYPVDFLAGLFGETDPELEALLSA